VLSCSLDRTLRLWDLADGTSSQLGQDHATGFLSVAFSPDGRRALSGGEDGTVRLWDVATHQELHSFPGREEWVWSVAFSPRGGRAVAGSGGRFQGDRFVSASGTVRVLALPPPDRGGTPSAPLEKQPLSR
jgi:WD40 repeat protein